MSNNVADRLLLLKPYPTQSETLKALSTLWRYVKDVNALIACKLEVILGSFNVKIHLDWSKSMKDATITHFSRDYD